MGGGCGGAESGYISEKTSPFRKMQSRLYRNGIACIDFLALAYGAFLLGNGIANGEPLEWGTGLALLAYSANNHEKKRADGRKIRQLEKKLEEQDKITECKK